MRFVNTEVTKTSTNTNFKILVNKKAFFHIPFIPGSEISFRAIEQFFSTDPFSLSAKEIGLYPEKRTTLLRKI